MKVALHLLHAVYMPFALRYVEKSVF